MQLLNEKARDDWWLRISYRLGTALSDDCRYHEAEPILTEILGKREKYIRLFVKMSYMCQSSKESEKR